MVLASNQAITWALEIGTAPGWSKKNCLSSRRSVHAQVKKKQNEHSKKKFREQIKPDAQIGARYSKASGPVLGQTALLDKDAQRH